MTDAEQAFTGFLGTRRVASGGLVEVALRLQALVDGGATEPVTLIEDATGDSVSFNLHGTPEQLRARLERRLAARAQPGEEGAPAKRAGPGRPKLGVVSREVSLLPSHWEWLGAQPGGASAILRRLVEQARRDGEAKDRARRARDAAYRFMQVMGGDLPGFEEASRALFAGDWGRLAQQLRPWSKDIREHALALAERARERAREAEAAEAAEARRR